MRKGHVFNVAVLLSARRRLFDIIFGNNLPVMASDIFASDAIGVGHVERVKVRVSCVVQGAVLGGPGAGFTGTLRPPPPYTVCTGGQFCAWQSAHCYR